MGVGGQNFKKEDELEDMHDELGIETEEESDTGILPRGFPYVAVENNEDDDEDDDDDDDDEDDDGVEEDDEEDEDFSNSDTDSFSVSSASSSSSSSSTEESEEDVPSDTSSVKSLGTGREVTEEDDLIKKIKKAKNIKKQQPPNIVNDEIVTSISFSPSDEVIAVGTMEGDICLYNYDLEKTELIFKYSAHLGSCRKIEYDESGDLLYSISEDKSIVVADSRTGSFKHAYDGAHTCPIYSLCVINKNLFCSGDDEGVVKLWDQRKKEEVFSVKIGKEYVSSLQCLEESSTLACSAGDGTVTGINMNTRRIMNKSEPYEAEFTCSGLFCSNTKLAIGTNVGSLLLYSWGQFTSWNDEFPSLDKTKHAINCMIPITENMVITGLDNGIIRATHLFPMRHVGIVGQHGSTIEGLDISRDGTLIASSSVENKVCFWNVKYFEDIHLSDKNKKDNEKAKDNNLPSSFGVNASDFFSGLA